MTKINWRIALFLVMALAMIVVPVFFSDINVWPLLVVFALWVYAVKE